MRTFKNMGENIPGGSFLGWNFPGGIHQGREFDEWEFSGGGHFRVGVFLLPSFSLKSLSSLLFFSHVFSVFLSFVLFFLVAAHKKDSFENLLNCFCPH